MSVSLLVLADNNQLMMSLDHHASWLYVTHMSDNLAGCNIIYTIQFRARSVLGSW